MSVLPEVSDLPTLSVDYFPTPWQAALFRCWGRQRLLRKSLRLRGLSAIWARPFWPRPGCQKPTESSRGPKPSRILIAPGGVYGGYGAILSQGNPISRRENRYFAEFYSFLIP